MSFISDYLAYTEPTEPPPAYHLFTAYGVIAALLAGKVSAKLTYNVALKPNLYIVYVGEPGGRKSTAMRLGQGLIRAAVGKQVVESLHLKKKVPAYPFGASATSSVEFIKTMHASTRLITNTVPQFPCTPFTLCASELSSFLMVSPDILATLVDIWDNPDFEYRTGNAGSVPLPNPYLTIMGCATPAWITAQLKTDIISGGFSRRALFVYARDFEKKDLDNRPDEILLPGLTAHAKKIAAMKGEMKWDPDARAWFNNWYKSNDRDLYLYEDPMTVGYARTKQDIVLKIATLVACSELSEEIHTEHIQQALAHLAIIEPNFSKVFRGIGKNPIAPLIDGVTQYLESMGGIATQAEITKKFLKEGTQMQIREVLSQLETAQQIKHCKAADVKHVMGEEIKTTTYFYATARFLEQLGQQDPLDILRKRGSSRP
jgi:hypothetical protein